jgi:hypothetical protein
MPNFTKEPYVPWPVWIWSVSIITALVLSLFGLVRSVQGKVEDMQDSYVAITVQLSQIQADLKNIDARILEIRTDIRNSH